MPENEACVDGDCYQYQSEIKANLANHVERNLPSPDPTDYSSLRHSLSASVRSWRVFTKQADALECASNLAHLGVMTFTYHHSNCSRRFFVVSHPLELWHRNKNRPHNYNYEIIAEGRCSKLYLDLEFNRYLNPDSDGAKMTDTFNTVLLHVLKTDFHFSLDFSHILNLDSSTSKKFSRHIIYQFPFPFLFQTNIEVGNVVIKACNLIRSTLNHDPKIDICESLKIPREELRNLLVNQERGPPKLFVDEGVYTKNRHFRLYGSTKFGRNAPLVLSPENVFTIPFSTPQLYEEYLLLASLVTYSSMIHTIIPNPPVRVKPEPPRELPVLESKQAKSPFPRLDVFILKLIRPCGIGQVLVYEQGSLLVFLTAEPAFCSNVQRKHDKSKVLYIVNVKRGFYYQKCHDPGCRGYQSKSVPLPRDVQTDLGLDTDPWDEQIGIEFDKVQMEIQVSDDLKRLKT